MRQGSQCSTLARCFGNRQTWHLNRRVMAGLETDTESAVHLLPCRGQHIWPEALSLKTSDFVLKKWWKLPRT